MKKIIFIISITLLAFNSQAQGTLQFNQVITVTQDTSISLYYYNGSTPGIGTSLTHNWDIYTVPSNKVAKLIKLDNVLINSLTSGNCQTNTFEFTLNDVTIDQDKLLGVWLKEGSQLKVYVYQQIPGGFSGSSTCFLNPNIFLSLIEYNIIPE